MSIHLFSTPGLMDLRSISMLGLSGKPNPSPIGKFGTGLKFAIAGVLRLGGDLTLTIGTSKYQVSTKERTFRDAPYHEIVMTTPEGADLVLPFTTSLGAHWEPWMIFRELWSNTKDEGGQTLADVEQGAHPDWTLIRVQWPEGTDLDLLEDACLLKTPALWHHAQVVVHEPGIPTIAYQGLRLAREGNALFSYNLLDAPTLTEDRTLADPYDVRKVLVQAWLSCGDGGLIQRLLDGSGHCWESNLDWHPATASLSPEFKRALIERKVDGKSCGPISTYESNALIGRFAKDEFKAAQKTKRPKTWKAMLKAEPKQTVAVSVNSIYTALMDMEKEVSALRAAVAFWKESAEELARQVAEHEGLGGEFQEEVDPDILRENRDDPARPVFDTEEPL